MRARLLGIGLLVIASAVAGCGSDDDGGGGASGSSIADAAAVADALGCSDTFQATDAEPLMGPVPESAGFCQAEGGVSFEVYGSTDEVQKLVSEFPSTGCSMLQGFGIDQFTTVAGANWMATVMGDSNEDASARVASTLDGEVHEFDCA